MSNFCFAILSDLRIAGEGNACAESLMLYAKQLNIGVQFKGFFVEDFLYDIVRDKACLVCNLSDSNNTINCEKLLCIDGCNSSIWPELPPLLQRLRKITDFVSNALQFAAYVELFIGTSGDDIDDFRCVTCDDSNLLKILIDAFKYEGLFPTIRIVVTKTQVNRI